MLHAEATFLLAFDSDHIVQLALDVLNDPEINAHRDWTVTNLSYQKEIDKIVVQFKRPLRREL